MLRQIVEGDDADIVLAVVGVPPKTIRRSLASRVSTRWGSFLYGVVSRLDAKRRPPAFDAWLSKDLGPLLSGVPILAVEPERTRWSDVFSPDDVATIRGHDLDVLIRIGFRILRGDVLSAARCGVWSLHHGDNRVNRGGPAGFWEVYEGWPETGSVLQILTEDLDGGLVIYRSASQTIGAVELNKANYYWKTLAFVPRMLKRLRDEGAEAFLASVEREDHPLFYSRRLYRSPGNVTMLRLVLRRFARSLRTRVRSRLFIDQWILLYADSPDGAMSRSLWRFKRLMPPKDRFWADPFVVEESGRHFVFFEEVVNAQGRGRIMYVVIDDQGSPGEPSVALERPYHLSYPFVFSHEGEYYMVPETAQRRVIELYRCVGFPDRWEFVMPLMEDVYACDATLLRDGDRWWMFANIREHDGASSLDELFLFSAPELMTSDWVPHPLNPIVSDVTRSRPAGRIFRHGGKLYRPSQDSGGRYGRAMKINHILMLTESEYREEAVSEIEPLWDKRVLATHTLNHEANITVCDALVRRPRFFG